MANYAQEDYALKFVSQYEGLQVIDRATGDSVGVPYDLTSPVRIMVEDGEYIIDTEAISPASLMEFYPAKFGGYAGHPEEPLRFENDGFIGSADLRDQRTFNDYHYHLDHCPISIQFLSGILPRTIVVRSLCSEQGCDSTSSDCLTVQSITLP